MSKQLRDAIDVYRHAYAERMADWKTNDQQLANAAAVIEADRQEVREQEVAKIVAWLRESAAWHDKHDDGLSGFDKISQGLIEAADAIKAGEYRNDE